MVSNCIFRAQMRLSWWFLHGRGWQTWVNQRPKEQTAIQMIYHISVMLTYYTHHRQQWPPRRRLLHKTIHRGAPPHQAKQCQRPTIRSMVRYSLHLNISPQCYLNFRQSLYGSGLTILRHSIWLLGGQLMRDNIIIILHKITLTDDNSAYFLITLL